MVMRNLSLKAAAVMMAALGLLAAVPAAAMASTSSIGTKSSYWAGYVATPKTGGAKAFKYATATFTVPALNCSATPNSYVYHFAGLGGYTSSPLDAAGIVEECSGGTGYYYGAEWNEYNCINCWSDVLGISPGDLVSTSVFFNATTHQMSWKVVDRTTGQYDQTSQCCASPLSSAEIITDGNIRDEGTADFGSIGFNTIKITDTAQGHSYPLTNRAWTLVHLYQQGPVTGMPDVVAGPISSSTSQSAFSNTWLRPT
jgi:hypothetical protein